MRPNGHIWMVAEQFYETAEFIFNCDDLGLDKCIFPIIMNYAFSCELSMKSLDSIYEKNSKEIDGDMLLSTAIIKSTIRPKSKSQHSLVNIFSVIDKSTQDLLAENFKTLTDCDLTLLLKKCDTYFEKSRYPFEISGASFGLPELRTLSFGLLKSTHAVGIAIERNRSRI